MLMSLVLTFPRLRFYFALLRDISGPCCIKLTINGKLDFNGNFHIILDADWLWCLVAMVVTINGKFYAMGPDLK